MKTTDSWAHARRLGGLRRFALAITVFNILGHTLFGFEQSWAQPLASLATAYSCELLVEWMDARAAGRRARFLQSIPELVNCLLPTHITGLAVAMLLYSSDRLLPVMFASAVAVASKATIRHVVNGHARHVFNPSNFGITVTLLMFPWVGIAPPYHFTENLPAPGYWILPLIICISGTMVNLRFTGRTAVILGWCGGFLAQAAVRNLVFGSSFVAALNPMTGVAFVLFTFYMITDPATTPFQNRGQLFFGLAVAAVYGLLVTLHVVFGFFFALTLVSAVRGVALYVRGLVPDCSTTVPASPVPATVRKAESV
jgi:Na+-translocating ferredoxin:NAD+ oxidoreductase RnfD subunit